MFSYRTMDDFTRAAGLPCSADTAILREKVAVDGLTVPNRIAIQPMEGCDGELNGAPSELVTRRYLRFARGGAGLIWLEATAVSHESRANPHQLWINNDNLDAFKKLCDDIRKEGMKANGFEPILILQLTHSGRYSKPDGVAAPRISRNIPIYEKTGALNASCIVTDDELKRIEQEHGDAARLAQEAGFDGVDIKACHRYLSNELFSAYFRPGEYGGSLENRARFYLNCIAAARARTARFCVTTRLNVYDGFPYPDGYGDMADFAEPLYIVDKLVNIYNVKLLNITMGNPYVNPHVNRPSNQLIFYDRPEDPILGVKRAVICAKTVKDAFPETVVIGSALTYARQFAGQLAAGCIAQGALDLAGFGRMAFAYPDFANDILSGGGLNPAKICVTCSRCSFLMRNGLRSGCPIRDPEYTALLKTVL